MWSPKIMSEKAEKDCVCVYFNAIINVWMPFSSNNTEILQTHIFTHTPFASPQQNNKHPSNDHEWIREEPNEIGTLRRYTRLSSRKMKCTNCSVVAHGYNNNTITFQLWRCRCRYRGQTVSTNLLNTAKFLLTIITVWIRLEYCS